MIGIGVLIGVTSGLCSMAALAMTGGHPPPSFVVLVLLFGGVPFAVGVLLVLSGIKMMRPPPPPDTKTFS